MAKRKFKRASFGLRWLFLRESVSLGLEYMLTGKLPKPRRKSKPKPKAKRKVSIDASKGRK